MYINEAISNTSPDQQFITRDAWLIDQSAEPSIWVLPTNTPDCCIIVSSYSKHGPCRCWQPAADDLAANDWTVDGGPINIKLQTE